MRDTKYIENRRCALIKLGTLVENKIPVRKDAEISVT